MTNTPSFKMICLANVMSMSSAFVKWQALDFDSGYCGFESRMR